MGDPYKGRLAGHTLQHEGKRDSYFDRNSMGVRECSCGAHAFCMSTSDAKKWHRQHKADVIDAQVSKGVDEQGREVHL